MTRTRIAVLAVTGVILAWLTYAYSTESHGREIARQRLSALETTMAREAPAGTPAKAVLGLLRRQGVAYEPIADKAVEEGSIPAWGITVYVGEWPGMVFRKGLHLTLRFDKSGNLLGHEVAEVTGS